MTWRCGGCGREVHEDRLSCLYCGWSKAEGGLAATAAAPVAGSEDPVTFRAGDTTWRFVAWALLVGLAAWWAAGRARAESDPSRAEVLRWIALAGALLGPAALAAQLLRAFLVKVIVHPAEGLASPSRRIPWAAIESVGYAGARLDPDRAVVRYLLDALRSVWGGSGTIGLSGLALRLAGTVLLSFLVVTVALVSGVLLPVLLVLSPFQPRVIVRLKDGDVLTWRDLRGESEFVRKVSAGIRRAAA